ncbi:MAG: hypothetical protein ABMA02_12810 [Saprospiraceae bacterium]
MIFGLFKQCWIQLEKLLAQQPLRGKTNLVNVLYCRFARLHLFQVMWNAAHRHVELDQLVPIEPHPPAFEKLFCFEQGEGL